MLEASAQAILARLRDDDVVLDVGGWAQPFPRADWVIDLLPYETRGLYGYERDSARERFTPRTWVCRDICDREPWPFEENRFDFAICAQTLEDVRDPVWVCSELARVARAGYVEVPSRLEEQSWGVQGGWVGWGHHHWLIDLDDRGLEFVFKHHVLHARRSDHFPPGFHATLSASERVRTLWWEGSFAARERVITDADEMDEYLAGFVAANLRPVPAAGRLGDRARRWLRRA